jgi:hypothetical protein
MAINVWSRHKIRRPPTVATLLLKVSLKYNTCLYAMGDFFLIPTFFIDDTFKHFLEFFNLFNMF